MSGWTACALLLVASAAGGCASVGVPPSPEDARIYEWFDGLGFPSTAGKPYVRVATGHVWYEGDGPAQDEYIGGFLLAEDATSFSLLTDDLVELSFRRGDGATFEVVDLVRLAGRRLDAARQNRYRDPIERPANGGFVTSDADRLPRCAGLVAFARHCAENGLGATAQALLAAARGDEARPVQDVAADELATSLIGRHVAEFANPTTFVRWQRQICFAEPPVSRTTLLSQLRVFLERFPKSGHVVIAEEMVELLEPMIADDEQHRWHVGPWSRMTREEQVAELIWRLRDAPGGAVIQPGQPYFCNEDDDRRLTDFAHLLTFGRGAVPQLVQALGDRRLTRCVEAHFTSSHRILRIGDAAEQALEEIAERELRGQEPARPSRDAVEALIAQWRQSYAKHVL